MKQAKAPTRLIDDGRVTIPVDIRRELGIEEGDYVVIEIEPFNGGEER